MKILIQLIIGLLTLNSAVADHKSAHFFWLMEQPQVKESLKDQFVLKTFYEPTDCRAAFCFNFVICTLRKQNNGRAEFLVHRVPGSSYYFQTPAQIETETYAEMPMLCES